MRILYHGILRGKLDHLRQYIDDGSNILFAFEPKNDVTANQLLRLLGLQLTGNALPPNQKEYGEDLILADVDHALYKMEIRPNYRFWPRYRKVFLNSASYLVQDSVPKDFEMDSFLSIQSNEEVDSNKSSRRNIAVGLSRHHQNKQQRIFVIADADFLSNKAQRQVVNNTSNLTELIYPIFDWLSYTEIPPRPPQMNRDNQFSLAKEGANGFRFIMLYVLSILLLYNGRSIFNNKKKKINYTLLITRMMNKQKTFLMFSLLSIFFLACEDDPVEINQTASLKVVHGITSAPALYVNTFNEEITFSSFERTIPFGQISTLYFFSRREQRTKFYIQ